MGSIQLKDVRKAFGAVSIINGVNLNIENGEFAVFVGPSGCGKSTLLRLIAGLEDVTSGQVLIDAKDMTDIGPAQRGLAMVFQSYALYPHMSVRGNIAFALKMAGQSADVIEQKVRKAAGDAEPDRLSRSQAAPALRRPAPARRDRPRDRARTEGVPVRRAALQSRRRAARADADRDRRASRSAQDDDDLCHARSGRGDDDGRQDRRARPRLGRAGRLAARALQQAERPLRRRLHRLADDEPDQGRASGEARRRDDRHPPRARRRVDDRGRMACEGAPRRASRLRHFRLCGRRRNWAADLASRGRGAAEAGPDAFSSRRAKRTCISSTRTAGGSADGAARRASGLRRRSRAIVATGGHERDERQTFLRRPVATADRRRVPKYKRSDLSAGIVHIGVGNFHRAHQAVYLDDLFNAGVDHDWAIVGAGVREPDIAMREKLAEQDWLTTVVEQEAELRAPRVTGVDDRFREALRCRRESRPRSPGSQDPHRLADRHRGRLLHLAGDPAFRSRPSRHRRRRDAIPMRRRRRSG